MASATEAASRQRHPRRRISGLILIDKPVGLTSNAVLQQVKRAFRAEKAGHTGTLDPLASGLLPICFGEATKFAHGLLDADKRYRAVLILGTTTETGDAEGKVLRERPVAVARDDIERALSQFRGNIMQVPHRYSALKRQGRALYDYARAGETVEIAARPVTIMKLDIVEWNVPRLTLDVCCSKGTYVRSLAEDIGDVLGCGAHLGALRRLAAGSFDIAGAIEPAQLESWTEQQRDAALLPLTTLVDGLPAAILVHDDALRFSRGQAVPAGVEQSEPGRLIAVWARCDAATGGKEFIGVGRIEATSGATLLAPVRLLASQAA